MWRFYWAIAKRNYHIYRMPVISILLGFGTTQVAVKWRSISSIKLLAINRLFLDVSFFTRGWEIQASEYQGLKFIAEYLQHNIPCFYAQMTLQKSGEKNKDLNLKCQFLGN